MFLRLVLLFCSASAWAGEMRPDQAFLAGREVSPGRYKIEFCEMGQCRDLVNPKGYTTEQWRELRSVCSEYSYLSEDIPSGIALSLSFLIAASPAGLTLKVLSIAGLAVLNPLDGKVASNEAAITDDISSGLLNANQTFPLTIDQFVDLRNGIQKCGQEYEWRKSRTYRRYINGWARPLG